MAAEQELRESAPNPFSIVHTSDVHVDDDYAAAQFNGDGVQHLRRTVAAASRLQADILLLVGDTFDHNRLASGVVQRAAAVLAEFSGAVVILPGNHDPAMGDSLFRHSAMRNLANVTVLGVECGPALVFPSFGLEIWGRPHVDFGDMAPLDCVPARTTRWRIVMAHGHYEPRPDRTVWPRPFWLFGDAEIEASEADYVALGHWNRAAKVGAGPTQAWYSGSPDYAQTVNLLRFSSAALAVTREAIDV